jgi:ABC-2 type transport system permease protein
MFTILRYTFSRMLGQVLGWGISLALLGFYTVILHDSFVNPQAQQQYMQLISGYPQEMMAFFGDMNDVFSPSGFLNVVFFSYMPLIAGIFIIANSAGILVGDEEKGTLDLVMAHPVSRTRLFWGRLAALALATTAILLIAWLGFVLPLAQTTLEATPGQIAQAMLSLFAALMFFGGLALMLSMLLPSQRLAAMTSGLLLVVSYILTSLVRLNDGLRGVEQLLPLHFYQGGYAVIGMNWNWFAGLMGVAAIFALLAWWRFERRDIRVAGEGNWGFTTAFFKKKDKIGQG